MLDVKKAGEFTLNFFPASWGFHCISLTVKVTASGIRYIGQGLQGPWIFLELRTVFQNNPYPFSQIAFVRTGDVMIAKAVACGKKNPGKPCILL